MKKLILPMAALCLGMLPLSAQKKAKAKAKTAKTTQQATEDKARAEKLAQMTNATQKVVFFDSIVVDKAKFLAQYRLSADAGRVMTYGQLMGTGEQPNAYAYVNELGSKCYYALEDDTTGHTQLYTSDRLDGKWGQPRALDGLGAGEGIADLNYPYMMADGVTLYFAAKGEESIGGYDIFVTRRDASSDTFLKPENIGMPFNSPSNDYMYAVDELNNIGWFATDRGQTAGKVCVYLFIPTTTRKTYAGENLAEGQLERYARIARIADTWGDGTERTKALARYGAALRDGGKEKETREFTFVINDQATYTKLADFRSPAAKEKMGQLQQTKAKLATLQMALDRARRYYPKATEADRKTLRPEILQSEKQVEEMEQAIERTEKEIRNAESAQINK